MTDMKVNSPDGREIENIYIKEGRFGTNAPIESQLVKTNITLPPHTVYDLYYHSKDERGYVSTGKGTGTVSLERSSPEEAPIHINGTHDHPEKRQRDFEDDIAFIDPHDVKITGDKVQVTKAQGPIMQKTIYENGQIKSSQYYVGELLPDGLNYHYDEYRAVASNGYEAVFAPMDGSKSEMVKALNNGINKYGQLQVTPGSGLRAFRVMSGNEIRTGEYINDIKPLPQKTSTSWNNYE